MSRAVVVTGASTGIGRVCCEHLQRLGFRVFAGVRNPADAESARAAGFTALRLDVTDARAIIEAVEVVTRQTAAAGLWGLVNNAGVAVAGPLEYVALDDMRRQLEVNVVGPLATIQAFLPQLRVARGRIVNISSISGRVAAPLFGPYSASKFALEALSDALRREVRPWGIEVSVVQPGAIVTPIWDKSMAVATQTLNGYSDEARRRYGGLIAAVLEFAKTASVKGTPALRVAEAVEHALTAEPPQTRYLVGTDAKLQSALIDLVSDRVLDFLMSKAGPKHDPPR